MGMEDNEADESGAKGKTETEKIDWIPSYMKWGSLLPVQGLSDKHVAADGVDVVDPTRGLISTCSCDTVADSNIFVLIWANLGT